MIEAFMCVCIYRYPLQLARLPLRKIFMLDKDHQNPYLFIFHLLVASLFFLLAKREKKKKLMKTKGRGKCLTFPPTFSCCIHVCFQLMSLKALKRTTCFQKSLCKIRNTWLFKMQLYFSSHYPLNTQVHAQATANEGTISSCMQTQLISCAFFPVPKE